MAEVMLVPSSSITNNHHHHHNPLTFFSTEQQKLNPTKAVSATANKQVWRRRGSTNRLINNRTNTPSSPSTSWKQQQQQQYWDHEVDMDQLVCLLRETTTLQQLHQVMSPWKGKLSSRFMVSLLCRETNYQRSLALLDWMLDLARYKPSIFAYNVVLRNILRAKQWDLATGLVAEMRSKSGISPDKFTYSTLITHLGKAGHLDSAMSWLQQMEQDRVLCDLILYSNLIELARKLKDYSKAIALFSKLRNTATPDLVAYNSMINVYGKARLFREARDLFTQMAQAGVQPDTVSYSTLLNAYVENSRFLEALSVFSDMRDAGCELDLTTCNIVIDVYGQLDMVKEADRLFWSLRSRLNLCPNVVTYNTMLRVYGEAELFGEAIHLFRLMQRKGIEQNVVTYNTMIKIYGKSLEHEKATNLVREMQARGIEPNAITYSTVISIWVKAGKLDRAAILFQKLRSSGVKIDQVLYQTMIVAYERAGLVAHAKRLLNCLKDPGCGDAGDVSTETAVVVLAKAGRIEEATWLFRRASDAGEVKDILVFDCMIELYSRNKKFGNVAEVFEKMRWAGYFPGSNTIALVLNAYAKLQEFEKAKGIYMEMQEEGCIFSEQVHFQMLALCGARRDFETFESIFEKLESDPNISKKELHLVAASVYERANRLDDASRIIDKISRKNSL